MVSDTKINKRILAAEIAEKLERGIYCERQRKEIQQAVFPLAWNEQRFRRTLAS